MPFLYNLILCPNEASVLVLPQRITGQKREVNMAILIRNTTNMVNARQSLAAPRLPSQDANSINSIVGDHNQRSQY